ncbi:hypothetical protein LTR15_002334 [Elasticomyces elasticus]|nr:hypothetical protein LTR15_002334 [Elasticomyces elasticus]
METHEQDGSSSVSPQGTSVERTPRTPPMSHAAVLDNGNIVLIRGMRKADTEFEDSVQKQVATRVNGTPRRQHGLSLPSSYGMYTKCRNDENEEQPDKGPLDVAQALEAYSRRMADNAITHNGKLLKAKATTAVYQYNQISYSSSHTKTACEVLRNTMEAYYPGQSLPAEIADLTEPYIAKLEQGDYQSLLEDGEAKTLFGHIEDSSYNDIRLSNFPTWSDFIFQRLGTLLADRSRPEKQAVFFCIGYAALLAFLQSNVTGPPLPFVPAKALFPPDVAIDVHGAKNVRSALLRGLSMDGIAAYKLTPNIELLCLADAIMTCPPILKNFKAARWAKMRIAFLQQRLLSEVSSTLQEVIYDDVDLLADEILGSDGKRGLDQQTQTEFLLERATVQIHHGLDKFARSDLELAKQKREFEYALTGLMGKRTKFQENDISQLVVLARSADGGADHADGDKGANGESNGTASQPAKLDLNDDTLLESISFSGKTPDAANGGADTSLPPALQALDPANQPQLNPLDSTLLLSFASSITNTSPQDGLTREETLPYATRVLEGGSSNWQVYTQALLVRSRIEGHRSRTVERGLLQLQALVDQVIADTASPPEQDLGSSGATSFLPRPKESESAPVSQRLRYIFQLATPTRWDLEAELAARWVQLGGLRSALEIYERLEMWAEAALCWAATEREDQAKKVVRRQLYHATNGGPDQAEGHVSEDETWQGQERSPPPVDAPRLYCILGDIDQSVEMYEKAWYVSGQRYARSQRSLGRYYLSKNDFVKAAGAYSKSLKVNQLNQSSWFALGCALLELTEYEKAVEAFSRCVQLDDTDAESWSNLAAALLRVEAPADAVEGAKVASAGDEDDVIPSKASFDPQKNRQDALKALKRAATLKRESHRIWENVLTVAASVFPPDYTSVLSAQKHIIDLRGPKDGERCIDQQILGLLAQHIISTSDRYDPEQPGLPRMFVKFMDENVVPLITSSPDLWQLVSKLALWRNKPSSALDAEEKAWRVVIAQPGWESDSEKKWEATVEATIRLCDTYESLGPRERTEGMGSGTLVEKGWNFKARTAVRNVMGKGKSTWEGTDGWERLVEKAEELKG